MDRTQVEQQWNQRGFSCSVWIDPPGQVWQNYVHDVDELVMVIEGTVEFEIADRIQRPNIGEEVLIPAHVLHTVRNVGNTTSRWLYGYKRRGI